MVLIFILSGCGENNNPPTQAEMEEGVEAVHDALGEIDQNYKVRASCNVISEKSYCLDYIGSMWKLEDTRLNYSGAGIFSENTCPYSNNGGCQTGAGIIYETVAWSYDYGRQPISSEALPYEIKACDVLPDYQWVTLDQLFLNN